jgi:hypothetical protein
MVTYTFIHVRTVGLTVIMFYSGKGFQRFKRLPMHYPKGCIIGTVSREFGGSKVKAVDKIPLG